MQYDCSTPSTADLTYNQADDQPTIRQSQVLLYFGRFGVLTKGGRISIAIRCQPLFILYWLLSFEPPNFDFAFQRSELWIASNQFAFPLFC